MRSGRLVRQVFVVALSVRPQMTNREKTHSDICRLITTSHTDKELESGKNISSP